MNDDRLVPLLEQYAEHRSPALRDELVESYLPLARAVARRFEGRGAEREDLQQVASIALMKAVERFEPERGFRFVTYAIPTIAGDVRNYLRDKASGMRVPRDARQKLYKMQQIREQFEREHMREPSARELADAMHSAWVRFIKTGDPGWPMWRQGVSRVFGAEQAETYATTRILARALEGTR